VIRGLAALVFGEESVYGEAAAESVRGAMLDQCDHDGRCSGQSRRLNGSLRLMLVCDECGAVTQDMGAVPYVLTPDLRLASVIAGA
jgi:hypothetical protein